MQDTTGSPTGLVRESDYVDTFCEIVRHMTTRSDPRGPRVFPDEDTPVLETIVAATARS
jgi:hypothetical protein